MFLYLEEIMVPALRKEFAKSKPDVVMTDFATIAGATVAEEMDIPLVINLPGPLSMLRTFVEWLTPPLPLISWACMSLDSAWTQWPWENG